MSAHVCYDDRNERCTPDHCSVIGCPLQEKPPSPTEMGRAVQHYVVAFTRPGESTTRYLGEPGCGEQDRGNAACCTRREADNAAYERNMVHGPQGYRYWVEIL